jgi:hypothetical protein
MALTVGCARCHDHKFDPISQKDYYALYAVFKNSLEPKDPPLIGTPEETPEYETFKRELGRKEALYTSYCEMKLAEHVAALRDAKLITSHLLAARFEGTELAPKYAQGPGVTTAMTHRWRMYLKGLPGDKDTIFLPWRAYAALPADQFTAKAAEITKKLQAELPRLNPLVAKAFADVPASLDEVAERYGKLLASFDGAKPRDNADEESLRQVLRGDNSPTTVLPQNVELVLTVKERSHKRELRRDADKFKATNPAAPPRAMSLQDAPNITEQHVFLRGNAGNWGAAVKPHFLTQLSEGDPKPFTDGSGRLELARDIASKDNPLTARVIVNRVWLHHFGQGLVRTPSDFGTRSDPPTHPELLDWLALRLEDGGWSIKKLHKLIMLSATYQQGSQSDPAVAKADPDNLLLSHFTRHRLDWEATRDSLLFTAGRLDLAAGGKPVESLELARRTVYVYINRQDLPGVFRAFDFASPDATSPQRFTTTVPQQALFLMNSPFVVQQAQGLMQRPEIAQESDPAQRVAQLYRAVYQRDPTPDERMLAGQFIGADNDSDHRSTVWEYGYGQYDEESHKTATFTRLPHFTGTAWQGGPKLPDPALKFVHLTSGGGHAGADHQHAAIRRWVSPFDGVVRITGTVSHMQTQGEGIRAHIVSSRQGELASWNVFHMEAATDVDNVDVKKGDTIDFIVDCRGSDAFDGFGWSPVIKVASAPVAGNDGPKAWSAADGFAGPQAKPLDAWVKYAQVLLESNEFVFVD